MSKCRTADEVLLLCLLLLYSHSQLFEIIPHRLSRLLSISFWIRAFRAALMAESRMFFSATRPTTVSGLSSCRNRERAWGNSDQRKLDEELEISVKGICINLVHQEGGKCTRVRLIVEPEEFCTMGLCLCAWLALIRLFSLSTGPWLWSIWKISIRMSFVDVLLANA